MNGHFHDDNAKSIIEFEELYKRTHNEVPTFEHLHKDRKFDYCSFHKTKKEGLHCALDDAMYLAKKFVNIKEEPADVTVETQ